MKRSEVFTPHEPPPAGLTRLRARLDARRPSPWLWAGPLLATAAAVLLAIVARPAPLPPLEPSTSAYALGLVQAEGTVLQSSQPLARLSAPGALVEIFTVIGP